MWRKQWEGTKEIQKEGKDFLIYLKRNSLAVTIFSALFLLIYSSWLGKAGLRIDSEFMINHPRTYYNYLVIGRPGLAFTQWLFGYKWFNAGHFVLFGYLLLCAAGVLFGYLCYRCGRKSPVCCAAFGLVMFTCPLFVEQFYFSNQIFGIAWAYVLCAAAVGFSFYAVWKNNLPAAVLAVAAMVWSFSTYQVYMIVCPAMVLVCFLLLYSRWELDNAGGYNAGFSLWKLALGIALQFALSVVLYWVIVKKWFLAGGYYLGNQIAWKHQTVEQGIDHILTHMRTAALGEGTFYTAFYGLFAVLSILYAAVEVCLAKKARCKWMYLLAVLLLQFSPFFMTIYMGTIPTERAQLVYPLVLTGNAVFLFSKASGLRRAVIAFAIFVLFWSQSGMTMRLLYTDEIREQEDLRLAQQIEIRLKELDPSGEKEVAFVGVHDCELNLICVRGSLIGNSVFNWDSGAGAKYLSSTARIWGTLHTLGYSFAYVWTEEQMIKARTEALTMTCFPDSGSVADKGEFIVVKLSEDIWQGELAK